MVGARGEKGKRDKGRNCDEPSRGWDSGKGDGGGGAQVGLGELMGRVRE